MALKRDPEKQRAWQQRSKPLKRSGGLKRTGGPKRSVPKARGRKPDGQPHDIIEQAVIDAARRFKLAARDQKVCARCGRTDSWDAHHVVEKSWLKANGFSRVEWYDPDNALRLCDEYSQNDCHGKHTRASRRLHLNNLKTRNLEYAFRVMGAAAGPYLRRRYRGEDERLDRLEQAHEQ